MGIVDILQVVGTSAELLHNLRYDNPPRDFYQLVFGERDVVGHFSYTPGKELRPHTDFPFFKSYKDGVTGYHKDLQAGVFRIRGRVSVDDAAEATALQEFHDLLRDVSQKPSGEAREKRSVDARKYGICIHLAQLVGEIDLDHI